MALFVALAVAALATQDKPPVIDPSLGDPAASASAGVSIYPPSFFTEYQPQTALDMVKRVPGFDIDSGGGRGSGGGPQRGFGEGGNVLINGSRPASKSDSVEDVLRRIPVASVERVELIRGNAPGIDMQGKAAVVNVIRKAGEGGIQGAVTARSEFKDNGDISPALRIEAQKDFDGRHLDGVFNYTRDSRSGGRGTRFRDYTIDDPLDINHQDALSYRDGEGLETRYEITGAYEADHFGGDLRATFVGRHGESGQRRCGDFHPSGHPRRIFQQRRRRHLDRNRSAVHAQDPSASSSRARCSTTTSTQNGGSTYESPSGLHNLRQDQSTTEAIARGILRFPSIGNWTFDGSSEFDRNTLDATTQYTYNGYLYDPNVVGVVELRTETSANARWQATPKLRVELGARYETSTLQSTGQQIGPCSS